MEERYIEIRFYYYIMKLAAKFKYSVKILDVIESYCSLADVDSNIIKRLVKQIRDSSGIINTYTEEAVFIGRQNKISYRKLAKETGISVATQWRLNAYYDKHPTMYLNITKKLPDDEYNEVYKFMKIVDILKEL